MWLLYVGAFSNAPTSNCPPAPSSAISHYHTYLKCVYGNSPISPNTKWQPSPGGRFISIAIVEGGRCRDEYIGHTLPCNVKDRKEISIEQILEPVKGQNKPRLVLMEGSPGIGKSTLAWELCRKWEEFSCMQQYSLVVLLRLREEKVQRISEVSHLFISYESKHKKSLVEEVSESQGSGVLFILDGFDELPKALQKESLLLDLIRGDVLPASTVLVTSRPSATTELLSYSPKHIEILGFTQESVEAYAFSTFSSVGKPEKLKKFMDSISASENPAINSLMYIPLNAAIIVQMYLDCKSDALLPHTLTELYTLLCLTILDTDLKIGIKKFKDLPADLHEQFLHLSQIAFDGILNEEVIFHSLPSDFSHFGFLDAVSALYGGGRVSYSFLHLTLQEFLAAYHISHLGSSGLEVFKQHGKDERWNVVWRFVAGLTKFEHYKGHMDSDLFIESREHSQISLFTIQCLFEAQSVDHFSSILARPFLSFNTMSNCTALDTYAIGFCIANFYTKAAWRVDICNYSTPFMCGLKKKTPRASIGMLVMSDCPVDGSVLKAILPYHVGFLRFYHCSFTNADLIHLSELIPDMTNLESLQLYFDEDVNYKDLDHGLFHILQQLLHSNVTTLALGYPGFCRSLRDSPRDLSSALKKLVCPSCGILEHFEVIGGGDDDDDDDDDDVDDDDDDDDDDNDDDDDSGGGGGGDDDDDDDSGLLASLVSAPSSLKSLSLGSTSLSGHVSYLKNNTCLTELVFKPWPIDWSGQVAHLVQILEHNKTLLNLRLSFNIDDDIDAMKTIIVEALPKNQNLRSVMITMFGAGESDEEIVSYMRTHHEELTQDQRIEYSQR